MIGRVPLGGWLWRTIAHVIGFIPGVDGVELGKLELFARINDWIMDIPQTAAKRGIFIGATLGGIAMSIRIILGIERTYISSS